MKLFACIAAKRFGSRARKHPRRQRIPLRPLTLRWRRLARPASTAPIARPAGSYSSSWSSHIHLHLGWSTTINNRFRYLQQSSAFVPPVRSFREPLSAGRSLRPGIPTLVRGHRPPRAAGASIVLPRSAFRMVDGAPIGVRPAMRRGVAQATDAPVSSMSRRLRILALAYRRDAIKIDAQVPQQLVSSARQPLMWARSAPRERTPDSQAVARSERVWTAKAPIELVWRARHSAAAGVSDGMMVVSGSTALAAPVIQTRSVAPATPTRVIAESEKARPVPLDPALVDRLTEDVIRRVERRVRIERERRGI